MKVLKMITLLVACAVTIQLSGTFQQDKTKSLQNKSATKTGEQLTGHQLFSKYCLSCHQADGAGVRNMFPPLAGNEKITGPSNDLIRIVLFGLEGPIEVNGRAYNQVMPAQDYLNDKQIADVLTYIRNTWGNKASPVKPDEVAKVRKLGKPKPQGT
jgi:mono/diheme cytochrome c family protein